MAEWQWIGSDRKRFYKLWTQKEAVLKSNGKSSIAETAQIRLAPDMAFFADRKYHLYSLDLQDDYFASLATESRKLKVIVRHVTI